MKNYYEILEVKVTASPEEISASYKRLIKIWHPDVNKAKDAIEKTKELNQAHATLSSESARRAYDLQFDDWGVGDPLERNLDNDPHGMRVTWTNYDQGVIRQTIIIRDGHMWVNGVQVQ